MTLALRTDALTKTYGRRKALAECTLEVPAGRVVGLVGPNGAGKSTLLKILARVLHPTAGTVTIRGKVVSMLELGIGFAPEESDTEHTTSVDLTARILGPRAVADADALKLELPGWDGDDLIIVPHPDVLATADPQPVTDHSWIHVETR